VSRDVPPAGWARVATLEQICADFARRLSVLEHDGGERSDRLDEVEQAVRLLVASQRQAQEMQALRQRRIEVRMEVLTVVLALVAVFVSVVTAVVHL
jgi:hypothetical protein